MQLLDGLLFSGTLSFALGKRDLEQGTIRCQPDVDMAIDVGLQWLKLHGYIEPLIKGLVQCLFNLLLDSCLISTDFPAFATQPNNTGSAFFYNVILETNDGAIQLNRCIFQCLFYRSTFRSDGPLVAILIQIAAHKFPNSVKTYARGHLDYTLPVMSQLGP